MVRLYHYEGNVAKRVSLETKMLLVNINRIKISVISVKKHDINIYRIGLAYVGRVGSTAVTVSLSIERYLAIRQLSSERSSKVLFWLGGRVENLWCYCGGVCA